MNTLEITWSNSELRRTRCFECAFLRMKSDGILGNCVVENTRYSRIKVRDRSIFSRRCSLKQRKPEVQE